MKKLPLYYFTLILLMYSCYSGNTTYATEQAAYSAADSFNRNYKKPQPKYLLDTDSAKKIVIGIAEVPLSKSQPESTMGNFITDAMLLQAQQLNPKTAIAILNYNSIKKNYLSPGNIAQGHILEMLPFNNKLVLLEISGSLLQEFCNHIAKNKGWPISGISFVIKENKATHILVNGKPINDHLLYLIVIPDYLAYGGNNCDFLIPIKKLRTDIFIRDLLIDHIKHLTSNEQEINATLEQRIVYEKEILHD